MSIKKTLFGIAAVPLSLAVFSMSVFAQDSQNIVGLAQDTEPLSTLVTAVVAGDLADTLADSDSSFTVFAPTNDAFDALPEGTLDTLLTDEGKNDLVDILTYHVVDSKVMSSDLSDGQIVTALNGDQLEVTIKGDKVMINGAEVTTADVEASNGVVHIIDGVLLPPADATTHSTADTGIINNSLIVPFALLSLTSIAGAGALTYAYNLKK